MFTTARRLAHAAVTVLKTSRTHGITDENQLEQLLADGQVDGVDRDYCPNQRVYTGHLLHTDGSQSCLDCGHTRNGPA